MANVAEYKKKVVEEFQDLFKEYPIVGVVNMEGLPTPQVQNMRASLRKDGIALRMTKKRLLKIILEQAEKNGTKGVSGLVEHLKGMPALIFTKSNPFKLYKKLQASKSSAPAKGGQEAPKDVIVQAGPTEFAPGPIIGELGKFKIKAGIDGGKVAIKEDAVVVKEGEVISGELAAILTRLGIEPMEIGLDLRATCEDGTIFKKDILDVDEAKYISHITNAHKWAFNLSVECAFITAENTDVLLGKAFNDAKALAIGQAIVSKDVIEELVGKANREATGVKQIVDTN